MAYDWLSNNNGKRIGFQFFAILARELGNDPLAWKSKDLQVAYIMAHDEIFGTKKVEFNKNAMGWRRSCLHALLKPNQKLPNTYNRNYILNVIEEAAEANLISTERVKVVMEYVNSAYPIKRVARRGIGSY